MDTHYIFFGFRFPEQVGGLLLGDQAQPITKFSFAGIILKIPDVLGNLNKRVLHNLLGISVTLPGFKCHTMDQFSVDFEKLIPRSLICLRHPQLFQNGLPCPRSIHMPV